MRAASAPLAPERAPPSAVLGAPGRPPLDLDWAWHLFAERLSRRDVPGWARREAALRELDEWEAAAAVSTDSLSSLSSRPSSPENDWSE